MSKKKAIIKDNKILCVRGPLAEMNIIVKDKQKVEWYSKMTKELFNMQQAEYGVQVYDQEGKPAKKFLKGFLTYVSQFDLQLNNQPVEIKKPPATVASFFPENISEDEELIDLIPEPLHLSSDDDEVLDEPEVSENVNAPDGPDLPDSKIDEDSPPTSQGE